MNALLITAVLAYFNTAVSAVSTLGWAWGLAIAGWSYWPDPNGVNTPAERIFIRLACWMFGSFTVFLGSVVGIIIAFVVR